MPPKQQARNAVEELRDYIPHPSRTNAIRHWHLDQIDTGDPPVAMLHIAVTGGGQVRAKGLGLDPVHAEIILGELDAARAQIAQYLNQHSSDNVIPIR
jgi:hypothetical protein